MRIILIIISILINISVFGQSYDSYFTGNETNITTFPEGGVCMMGGGTEHDEAMRWFLQRADGGDILVLRASGSDGYNDYFYSDLGITVNSVESIVFNDASASNDEYIHQKIQQAEAIWFAGGDQWDYVSYWRKTKVDTLINEAIKNRNIVIGGTSAGMAILGGYYFSAENGTVTSDEALANPYNYRVTVDSEAFITSNYLADVITDTHYDNRDRKGRHVVFLARIFSDYGIAGKGIACNEKTAVCIDVNGIASVYGRDNFVNECAYFIQTNPELADVAPENCSAGNPLDWNLGKAALKVYKVNATNNGLNTFDLNDWETGDGGVWENWYVDNGSFFVGDPSFDIVEHEAKIKVFPNPVNDFLSITFDHNILNIRVFDLSGIKLYEKRKINHNQVKLDFSTWNTGFYSLCIDSDDKTYFKKVIKE